MITLHVKHQAVDHAVAVPPDASVLALKQSLEEATGLVPRAQKLIHKGKVLEDTASLAACKLADGAKLMLLGLQGPAIPGRAGHAAAAANSAVKHSTAARRTTATTSGSSSSALADKAAHIAQQQQRQQPGGVSSLAERKAAWSKTGAVALRDLQLASLEPHVFEGLAVERMRLADLSHNQLAALPGSLSALTGLSTLKASHNALADAGVPWQQLCAGLGASLASLQLGHNQLTRLPSCLSGLSQLTQLSGEGNALRSIEPDALQGLTRLEVLQLQGNALQALPASLGSCCSLVAVNASHNALTALPDSITQLTKLQLLAVDANKIKALPPQLLSGCSSLCTLAAHQNPITVEDLRAAQGYEAYEARRQARASKQLGGRVMADSDRAFSEGADVEQWQRWVSGATGLGADGSGRLGRK